MKLSQHLLNLNQQRDIRVGTSDGNTERIWGVLLRFGEGVYSESERECVWGGFFWEGLGSTPVYQLCTKGP